MENNYAMVSRKIADFYTSDNKGNWHNGFHIDMPFGLINDPNGLCEHQGEIYIFYQWNPFGCEHKNKHWGLVKTKDFITYSKPEIVLRPNDWFDKNGCYSGCAVSQSDGLELIYTGNVKNADNERESYQVSAAYKAGKTVKQQIVINKQPAEYTAHFRDPYYFQQAGKEYMVIGAQSQELKGCIALYEKIAGGWQYRGRLKTGLTDFGYMWECPNMVKLGNNKMALLFCPQGLEAVELAYQNKYQAGYIIGELDTEKLAFYHEDFQELDYGFDFYAPQVFEYQGEAVLIGWSGMPDCDDAYPTAGEGWRFALTMPRVLQENNGRLLQQPHSDLLKLRQSQMEINSAGKNEFAAPNRQVELTGEFELSAAGEPAIELVMGEEWIKLSYDAGTGIVTLDRNGMELGGRGIRSCRLHNPQQLLVQLFIDKSQLEIYLNDGSEVMTAAYFPKSEKMNIRITGSFTGKLYELDSFKYV